MKHGMQGAEAEGADGALALPEALMTMMMNMVESRIALMGMLSRCATVTEANETMTGWLAGRISEFGEDQARVTAAMLAGVSQLTSATNAALGTAGTPVGVGARAESGAEVVPARRVQAR